MADINPQGESERFRRENREIAARIMHQIHEVSLLIRESVKSRLKTVNPQLVFDRVIRHPEFEPGNEANTEKIVGEIVSAELCSRSRESRENAPGRKDD